jgi:hypothetical protein
MKLRISPQTHARSFAPLVFDIQPACVVDSKLGFQTKSDFGL